MVGGVVGELRNKTKLQPSTVEVELWLSLAKMRHESLPLQKSEGKVIDTLSVE